MEHKSKQDISGDETVTINMQRKKNTAPERNINKDAAKETTLKEACHTVEDVSRIRAIYSARHPEATKFSS